MPKIFVLTGPDVGLEAHVESGTVFGRSDDCRVRLKDASISRHHARIEQTPGGLEIVDMESRNGLIVQGERASRWRLVDGEEFNLGNVRIRFINPAPSAVEEIELAPEAGLDAQPTDRSSATASKGPSMAAGSARRRAIAKSEGILQFEKIDDVGGSPFSDEFSQYSFLTKALMFAGAFALAAGLFYAAWRIAWKVTPEAPENSANTEQESGK